jgi:uncharacterized cupin superfamily protein
MSEVERHLVRRSVIDQQPEIGVSHPMNPNSEVWLRPLAARTGLTRTGVTLGRIPPGKESFVYHAHEFEEEWIYVLSGRGVAELGDEEFEVGEGDFLGFPAPGPGHHLRNPFDAELVYLMGGENREHEFAHFPRHGRHLIRTRGQLQLVDDGALEPFVPKPITPE